MASMAEGKKEEPAQDSPGTRTHLELALDAGGSLGSSREFEEPNLPWAEEVRDILSLLQRLTGLESTGPGGQRDTWHSIRIIL